MISIDLSRMLSFPPCENNVMMVSFIHIHVRYLNVGETGFQQAVEEVWKRFRFLLKGIPQWNSLSPLLVDHQYNGHEVGSTAL